MFNLTDESIREITLLVMEELGDQSTPERVKKVVQYVIEFLEENDNGKNSNKP